MTDDVSTVDSHDGAQVRRTHSERFGKVAHAVMHDPSLSMQAKAVYGILATYANASDRGCWPGQRTLAEGLGSTVSTVRRLMRELEDAGYLATSVRNDQSGAQRSNMYVLLDGHLMVAPASKSDAEAAEAADLQLLREMLDTTQNSAYPTFAGAGSDDVRAVAAAFRAQEVRAPGRYLQRIELEGGPSGVAAAVKRAWDEA